MTTICQLHRDPGTLPVRFASGESKFTDNCSNCSSQSLCSCDYCEGEGWIYLDEEEARACPECHGSGWIEGEPDPLTLEDLDYRAPIDTLLEHWCYLEARDLQPGTRRRIAGVCDKRLSWQYRVSEC